MRKTIAILLIVAATAYSAGDPEGFHIWKASQMDADAKTLATKLDAHHVASEPLGAVGNRTFSMAHREGPGQAEWHEKQADILMIHSGAVIAAGISQGRSTSFGFDLHVSLAYIRSLGSILCK